MWLSVEEEGARQGLGTLSPKLPPHVLLDIRSEGTARLNWVTPALGQNPIRLRTPPDARTQLQNVTKLMVPAQTDLALLTEAPGLRWLVIEHLTPETATADWLHALGTLIRNHLPHLETLELSDQAAVNLEESRNPPIRIARLPLGVAYGRENILDLLRFLAETPLYLFEQWP